VFLFTVAALTVPMLLVPMAIESHRVATAKPLDATAIAGVGYVALFASVLAFTFWNRAVGMVGANIAGFSLALLPAFGTVLAIVFLGERLHAFHAIGFATILAGFVLASLATNSQRRAAPAASGSPATPPA
jgi:drug/metabolite transporter (DMT)-like permease